MIKQTFICDGCGKTIPKELASHFEFFQIDFEQDGMENKHYCIDCAIDIYQFVRGLENKEDE